LAEQSEESSKAVSTEATKETTQTDEWRGSATEKAFFASGVYDVSATEDNQL